MLGYINGIYCFESWDAIVPQFLIYDKHVYVINKSFILCFKICYSGHNYCL